MFLSSNHPLTIRRLGTAAACLGIALLAGCACHPRSHYGYCERTPHCVGHSNRGRDLIFNPEWTGLAVFEPGRSDWPSTVASEQSEEAVEYQEVIHDNQGRFGLADNSYFRQFDSYRYGHVRR